MGGLGVWAIFVVCVQTRTDYSESYYNLPVVSANTKPHQLCCIRQPYVERNREG